MLHRNLGVVDRLLRFALAFWWLGPWVPEFETGWMNWVIFVVAWIALVESFLGWCALHNVLGLHECGFEVPECEDEE